MKLTLGLLRFIWIGWLLIKHLTWIGWLLIKYLTWISWFLITSVMVVDIGICSWLSDFAYSVTAFISMCVSQVVIFIHQQTEPCWTMYYSIYNLNDQFWVVLDWFWNTLDVIKDTFATIVTDLYELELQYDLGILLFFLIFCGDFALLYREYKVRELYRKTRNDFNRKFYASDYYYPKIDLDKWGWYNNQQEKGKYGAVREKVVQFIKNNEIDTFSLFCEDIQTLKVIKKLIKEELLKMKKGLTQVKENDWWGEIVPTTKALQLESKYLYMK